jgi:probable F420-dependent oxidoreductase
MAPDVVIDIIVVGDYIVFHAYFEWTRKRNSVSTATVVDSARLALGPVGAYLPVPFATATSIDAQREAAGRLERAGYRAVWTNEVVGGKDAFVQLAMLLAGTERMAYGTGIANIWARQPQTCHGASALLAQAYPSRFVLGLGVGYPEQAASTGQEFGKPLTTMRNYLDRMAAPGMMPAPEAPYPRIIAANGPKMLELAGQIADGAIPAMLPPEFTAQARQLLGPDKLLVVGLAVVTGTDPDKAKAAARDRLTGALGMRGSSYAASITRLGYPAREIAEASDRLTDAIVAYGSPAAIAAKVREHKAAGADHVILMLTTDDFTAGVAQLEELAPALAGIS